MFSREMPRRLFILHWGLFEYDSRCLYLEGRRFGPQAPGIKGLHVMSNISRFPPSAKTVHVEADIPASQLTEFNEAIVALVAGERPRMDNLDRDVAAISRRAMAALTTIEMAINNNPTTGQARRLVRFLAGVYNGTDFPFDLTDLRALDTELANACLDYLNYDRLAKAEVHTHLQGGGAQMQRWILASGTTPKLPLKEETRARVVALAQRTGTMLRESYSALLRNSWRRGRQRNSEGCSFSRHRAPPEI